MSPRKSTGIDHGGPYTAADLGGPIGWWGVLDRTGINVLRFACKRGSVVTAEQYARIIADAWNAGRTDIEIGLAEDTVCH